MANITLKIEDELLKKARRLAAQRNTSINALVREKLDEFVSGDRKREAALRGLDDFFARSGAKIGKKAWTRDELHDR